MIGWMQKNRSYLVVTIWISTIAFVGAGFVGWGSYEYGGGGDSVAKVNDKKIDFETYQLTYQNLYNQYNAMLGGKMDQETAKQMGIEKVALDNLINQTHFLVLADEYGIIVSDEEIAKEIASIKAFQTDGKFDATLYKQTIAQMRLKPAQFEKILTDELKITKLLDLFAIDAFDKEKEAMQSIVADKIEYKVLSLDDVSVTLSEDEAKEYYQTYKNDFKTSRKYKLAVLWTSSEGIEYTDEDIDAYYEDARFNHRDEEGKILPLDAVYDQMVKGYQMERAKVQAQRDYIAFKDAKIDASEELTLDEYEMFYEQTWEDIINAQVGDVIKPNAHDSRYASIKVQEIIQPQVKPYDEVKDQVHEQAKYEKSLAELEKYANSIKDDFTGSVSGFFTLSDVPALEGLNEYESFEFAKFLFSQEGTNGVFRRGESAIVYKILEQKLISSTQDMSGMKEALFQESLLQSLKDRYTTKIYIQ
jgi:peptidyl-prolyl cis-trans isomerase D